MYLFFFSKRRLTLAGRKLVKTEQVSFKGVAGSGSRLLRSSAKVLESNESRHAALAQKIVQHVYNGWNKFCGHVTTETGADYKVIISQDGMYKGHVEILAM